MSDTDPKPLAPPDWREQFEQAVAQLPEHVELPYAYTPEGERLAVFKRMCPAEFLQKIDRALLLDPAAFDRVALWDGSFPGPMAWGAADTAKTRAVWSALGRLYVRGGKPYAWFTGKRLVAEMHEADQAGALDSFFRRYAHYPLLMVDDVEKINWDFGSNAEMLFAFYDWIYRERRSCLSNTNKSPQWWEDKVGEGLTRRLFKDGHFAVEFKKPAAERAAKMK